eukprot:gene23982-29029_t
MENKSPKVVIVGSLMIDLTAYTPSLPTKGETIMGNQFAQSFGGKGANQAVQSARLGVPTQMIGCVGMDSYGHQYLQQLQRMGVQADSVTQVEDDLGNNSIVIIPGANTCLSQTHILPHTTAIHHARVVCLQNEVPVETTRFFLEHIQKHNQMPTTDFPVLSIFNPAPATAECAELISFCDVVCANEVELAFLSKMPTDTLAEVEAAAMQLLRAHNYVKCVVATLGSRGCMLVSVKGFDHHNYRRFSGSAEMVGREAFDLVYVEAEKVQAVDTVGAGDSFIGCLAANLTLPHVSLHEALQRAVRCATYSVQRKGSQVSYVGYDEAVALGFIDRE